MGFRMAVWHFTLRPVKTLRPDRAEQDRRRIDFDAFFRARFTQFVRFLMMSEAAQREDAEDAVEAAMLDAYRRWSRIDNPEAWVRQAARRIYVRERMRDRERRRRSLIAEQLAHPVGEDWTDGDASMIVDLVRRLPPAQREVIAYTMDFYGPSDIAQILGKSPQAVRSNLRAARRRLAELYRESRDGHETR
ncbi:RNA polymerase sigma factor [Mangrovihabitans endophyticus]|uniref:RNA polymerase sigma factor 70 region 4 type 2 domain-containing protein n=1 Tax=Mangrovihabitans endophyticus TaxID=1751298 RepID=A0A8J3FRQ5_9ACTN|nr:sigma factor-like helix-turn-helix DNA-binding protein [Mangrovihabitans endophyticus]GGL08920.1 hypothetical protein GCM10012284_49450 [Mangrovihabitans endophyticus]